MLEGGPVQAVGPGTALVESEKRNDQETFLDRNCLRRATIGWGNIGPDLWGFGGWG
jgi:hypothetical protein